MHVDGYHQEKGNEADQRVEQDERSEKDLEWNQLTSPRRTCLEDLFTSYAPAGAKRPDDESP